MQALFHRVECCVCAVRALFAACRQTCPPCPPLSLCWCAGRQQTPTLACWCAWQETGVCTAVGFFSLRVLCSNLYKYTRECCY